MWNNNVINYKTNDGLKDLIGSSGIISFMSPSIYEKKYNKTIDFKIDDNEMYISSYLSRYAITGSVSFYDYDYTKLGRYYSSFINMNNILTEAKLVDNSFIQSNLDTNEVVISEDKFKLLGKNVNVFGEPCTYIDDTNRDAFLNVKNNYNLDFNFVGDTYDNKYVLADYNALTTMFEQKKLTFICLLFMIILVELSILYVFENCLIDYQKGNIRQLNQYYNNRTTLLFYNSALIIPIFLSTIFSLVLTPLVLNLISQSLHLKVLSFSLTLESVLIFLLINIVFSLIGLLIENNSYKKKNK